VQLLNDRWEIWNINFHYGAPAVPLIAVAAVLGLAALPDTHRWSRHRFAMGLGLWLGGTATYAIGWAVTPRLFGETDPLHFTPRDARWEALASVDATSSVCAQQDLAPHLADRPIIHAWPRCDDDDRYIVLDATGMPIDPKIQPEIAKAIERLRADPSVDVIFDREGAFVGAR
jgi:hypothetical protein